jgi:uncharacterized protein (DUF58 family)
MPRGQSAVGSALPGSRLARLLRGPWRERARPPVRGRLTLDRRHLYILPTRSGLGFGVLLLAMLLTALNYNVSLGFALTFLLAGIGMACMWQAYRNLLELTVSAGSVAPVFAGATAAYELRLHNPDAHARIGIQASLSAQAGMAPAEASLDGEGDAPLTLRLPAARRGPLALPRVTLSSRFPLGLFRVWSHADFALTALVYPAPEPSPPPLPFANRQDDEGLAFALPADDGADALRRYRVGDPLHRIAWKHSARTGRLLSRTGQTGSQPACWLDWQALPPRMGSEQRLSRLCAWVLAAGETVEFGLRIPGIELAPGRGASHRRACLEALALWQPPAAQASAPGAGTVA